MVKDIKKSLFVFGFSAVVCSVTYPAIISLAAGTLFKSQANGSLVYSGSVSVASSLIGQNFSQNYYFHPRPSAAGEKGYDAAASGGSNLGYTSQKLYDSVKERVQKYRELNFLGANDKVPMDAVTASASGLDPHISTANAALQTARVAKCRNVPQMQIDKIVKEATEPKILGFIGVEKVNVVALNMRLDKEFGKVKN